MSNKIGIGVVTYNRVDFFKQCINTIPDGVGTLVVINDGTPYSSDAYPSKIKEVIQHTTNKCVGVSKNEALRYLKQDGCEHLFLVEDDMLIKRPDVFETYIKAASKSGIWHMNYGPGSPLNRVQDPEILKLDLAGRDKWDKHSPINPRCIIDYGDGVQIALYKHTVAMFSYFLKGVITNCGYFDERFQNAWEHVEHTYRIIKAGLHPPFWNFADIYDSTEYLQEIEGAIENSSITKDDAKWKRNIQSGAELYQYLHGHYPAQVKDATPEEVQEVLRHIKTNYARDLV